MRIAILGSAYPFRGGLAAYNELMAQKLLALGHEVRIFTFTVQYPKWLFPGKTQYRSEPPPEGLSIQRTLHAFGPLSWWQTGRRMAAFAPELVLTKFWLPVMGVSLGSALRVLKQLRREVLRLAILDNVIPHEARPGDRIFTRYFIGSVEGAVAMSDSVADDWQRLTYKPVLRLFHPLYTHYGEKVPRAQACQVLGLDPRLRYLLFFGLIRPYKGLDLLLQAWQSEKLQRRPEVRLLIAGELYEPYAKYEPLLTHPAVRDRVIFREGFVPEEAVRYYFSAADVLVLPYLSATQSGITQIALHFEVPMIATRVGGLPEVVHEGQTGLLCAPDPIALAETLDRFLQLPPHAFAEGLQAYKQSLSWERFLSELLNFAANLRLHEKAVS